MLKRSSGLCGRNVARSQIHGAVFRVQRPRVLIKIVRTGLPNFLLRKMNHVRQRGTRQRAIHESQERFALFPIRDVFRFGEGFEHRFFGPLFGFHEFIESPPLPGPNVVAFPLSAIDQFMPVQIRQAVRVSGVVPVVVAVLRPIDPQPSKRSIDDSSCQASPMQRRRRRLVSSVGRVLLERGLHFGVRGAQFRIGRPETPVDHAVKRLGIFERSIPRARTRRPEPENA